MTEAWVTDSELIAAQSHFTSMISGYVMPAAYSVARFDSTELTFAHINHIGEVRPLPAAVLAFVCGYISTTGTYRLNRKQFERAIVLLSPAEAATHMEHPNLWSWRELLNSADSNSDFLACFVTDPLDAPVSEEDAQFRQYIHS
ncbi:MAG: hypothetical protein WA090_03100 [Candidatus Nanopelagicaceae bacterium]